MTPEEFWTILHDAPAPRSISFRLYYDENGMPIVYTMDDIPGNYIEIDPETFARGSSQVRVVEGRLIKLHNHSMMPKLRPNQQQGTACHPQDVCVIVDPTQPHVKWST